MGRQAVAVVVVVVVEEEVGGVIAMRWEVAEAVGAVGMTVKRDRWQGASLRGESL